MLTALLILGCTTSTSTEVQICEVDLVAVTPEALLPGDEAVLTATPLTTDYDTALYLSGVRAQVTAVDRSGCEECDTCREDAECLVCQDCDTCDALCASDCLETVRFVVPELPPGPATVQLYNTYGGSDPLTVEILGAPIDTSGSDTAGSGTAGSGTADSGTADSGTADSGTADSGTADSGTAGSGTAGSGTSGSSPTR